MSLFNLSFLPKNICVFLIKFSKAGLNMSKNNRFSPFSLILCTCFCFIGLCVCNWLCCLHFLYFMCPCTFNIKLVNVFSVSSFNFNLDLLGYTNGLNILF